MREASLGFGAKPVIVGFEARVVEGTNLSKDGWTERVFRLWVEKESFELVRYVVRPSWSPYGKKEGGCFFVRIARMDSKRKKFLS